MTLTPELVRSAGVALFGSQWRTPLARLLDVDVREMTRISRAADNGLPYTPPAGWAAELKAALAGVGAARTAQAQMAQEVMTALADLAPHPDIALTEAERQRAAL